MGRGVKFGKFAVLHVEIPDPKTYKNCISLIRFLTITHKIEFQFLSSTLKGCTQKPFFFSWFYGTRRILRFPSAFYSACGGSGVPSSWSGKGVGTTAATAAR